MKDWIKIFILRAVHQLLVLCLLTGFFFIAGATEMKVRQGVKGIWLKPNEEEDQSFLWNAHWIWQDENLKGDVILARKTFNLDEIPANSMLRISASSQYQLWVNGEYICRGPARSAPHHQSYDILEIAGLLKKGENVIAVRVHHQKGKYSYHFEGRAGLLAQLDFQGKENLIISDSSWKVSPDNSWDNEAPVINRFQQVVCDRIDFRDEQKGWNEPGFNDSAWENASALMRKEGWPLPQGNALPQALTPPWTSLVPRDIPCLTETDIRAVNLIEAFQTDISFSQEPVLLSGRTDLKFNKNEDGLELPVADPNQSWFLLFDFGEVINGMPKLHIQGDEGATVDILCAPFVVDNKFSCKTVDSEFLDRIVLSGNQDIWEATYFKPTRYLGIVIRNSKSPAKLFSAGIHQVQYPFERKGFIESEEAPWLKKYTDASAKTINVCTTDAFTDNYRERRQYAQTGYYAAMGNYRVFGDYALQRRYLVQVAQEQEPNGIMPAYAPAAGNDFMIILDSNCLWIRSLRNYLLYSGDDKTVRELLPAAKKLMDLLHSYTGALGMIDNPPYAYWLDHAVNDRRGANFNLNGHYLGALQDFAELLDWLNETDSKEFENRAALLQKSLQNDLWDNEKQLFADALIDGKRSEMFSEHANAMALALNIATREQAQKIAKQLLVDDKHNFIKRESGITMVTPAMSYFLHKGLCEAGYIDESFAMFSKRFDKMLAPDTNGTLWEEWWPDATGRTGKLQKGRTRSDAQTESAFAPALFTEYLVGVQPTFPGMKEVEIKRTNSTLKNMESEIPTPEGILKINWKFTKNSGKLELYIPGEIVANLNLESLRSNNGKTIKINGKSTDMKTPLNPFIKLTKGNYTIEF